MFTKKHGYNKLSDIMKYIYLSNSLIMCKPFIQLPIWTPFKYISVYSRLLFNSFLVIGGSFKFVNYTDSDSLLILTMKKKYAFQKLYLLHDVHP